VCTKLSIGRRADLSRVNDARIHLGGIRHISDVDMLRG
jgi:hypothetical protein